MAIKQEEEKVLFKINDEFYITADSHNVVVNRKTRNKGRSNGKDPKTPFSISQTYHSTLENALIKVYNSMTRDKPTSLTNALKVFKEAKEEIIKAIK